MWVDSPCIPPLWIAIRLRPLLFRCFPLFFRAASDNKQEFLR
jgi:hypothetical protein